MLIPVHFSIAQQFPMDFTLGVVTPGTVLTLAEDSNSEPIVKIADGGTDQVIGLAADGYKTDQISATKLGYAADIVTGANGVTTTRSQDRINDLFREPAGSGLMTVYSGVGTFRTTEYTGSASTVTPPKPLYVGTSGTAGLLTTSASTTTQIVGRVVHRPSSFPSGVPGTDINGSMSLGTLLTFELNV